MATKIHQTQDAGNLQVCFNQAHREQQRAVTASEIKGYNTAVQTIYGVAPSPTEVYHEKTKSLKATTQGMKNQRY